MYVSYHGTFQFDTPMGWLVTNPNFIMFINITIVLNTIGQHEHPSQSVSQSVTQSVCQPVSSLVNQSVSLSVSE